jgi:hypothetical protein
VRRFAIVEQRQVLTAQHSVIIAGGVTAVNITMRTYVRGPFFFLTA